MASKQLFIELVGQQGSGFIKDGTAGTSFQEELRAPTIAFIPVTGYRRGPEKEHIPIRYIKNCPFIDEAEQKAKGISPNRNEDIIQIERGYTTIELDGADPGLIKYFTEVYYNESNPNRSDRATALYRIIDVDENNKQYVEREMAYLDAAAFVSRLRKLNRAGEVVGYDEDKMNTVIELLSLPVPVDTPSGKLSAILSAAKSNPTEFMRYVTKLEESAITEITNALELGVIQFKGNVLQYTEKDEVIHNFGTGSFKKEKLIEFAANFLTSPDNKDAYKKFQIQLEVAEEKQLTNA